MSYYHQNPDYDVYAYEYDDDGNHGNNEYEYDSDSDYHEPDHCGFEDSGYNNADHGDSPEGFEYGHGEPDNNGYEPMEPGYEDDEGRTHWEGGYNGEVEGYEHEEVEDEGDAIDETHEHGELVYETCEPEELERMANERGHALEHYNNGAQGTNGYRHDDDDDAHASTCTYARSTYVPPTPFYSTPAPTPRGRDPLCASQRGHVTASNHAQAAREPTRANHNTHEPARTDYSNTLPHSPVTLPEAPCLTPAPKSPIRPPVISPAEYHLQDTGYTNTPYRPPIYIPNGFPTHYTFPPMSDNEHDDVTTTFLEQLRRECDEGTENAIYFAEDIWDFTENCQHEEAEYKADRLAEIRSNHSIQYPKRDYLAVPRSWNTFGEPGNGLPHTIEGSRPIRPALKRRRYRNARTPRYHTSQPRLPRVPRPPPDPESNITPGTPSPPTMRSNKHHVSNRTPKPTYHVNSRTSPYSTSRLRPPPWPNKHPTRNGNQHQENGRHTPARNTVGQQPPPWPNIPISPILSIANSRPTPWPNICHCHHRQYSPVSATPPARPPPWPIIPRHLDYTLHNRQNAKRRIKRQAKAKSRLLSEHN
jgi:hypothetical protein